MKYQFKNLMKILPILFLFILYLFSSNLTSTGVNAHVSDVYNYFPVNVIDVSNFTTTLQFNTVVTPATQTNTSNTYVIVAFGSNNQKSFNGIIVIEITNSSVNIEYGFASDVTTDPITFAQGDLSMITMYGLTMDITFTEYGIYGFEPTIISAIALTSTQNLLLFESRFGDNMNIQFSSLLTLNEIDFATSSSTTTLTSTTTSTSHPLPINEFPELFVLVFSCLYIKRKYFNR